MIGGIQYASALGYGTPQQRQRPTFRDIFGNNFLLDDLTSYAHNMIYSNDIIKNEYTPQFDFNPQASTMSTTTSGKDYDPSKILHPSGPITPKYKLPKRGKEKEKDGEITPELDFKGYMSADNLFDALGSGFKGKALENYKVWTEVWKKYGSDLGIADDTAYCYLLAQLCHESGNFSRTSENLNYSAAGLMETWPSYFPDINSTRGYARYPEKIANKVYANRMGNGSEASGDGWRYRGRGLIQLTGKDNYKTVAKFLKELGVEKWDIVSNPDYVANDPEISALATIGYIKKCRSSNAVVNAANTYNVDELTKTINGGHNGLDHRKELTGQLLEILNNYNSQNPNSDLA